jgi:antirestriction protein ArdC
MNKKNLFPDEILDGLCDCLTDKEIKELGISYSDLGKASKKSPYEVINDRLIELLKQGDIPWINQRKKPSFQGEDVSVRNAISNRAYTGINAIFLNSWMLPHHNSMFLTKKQIEEKGGNIARGAKPFPVYFSSKFTPKKEASSTNANQPGTTTNAPEKVWFLKEYQVYNLADTDLKLKNRNPIQPKTEEQVIESCETIYPNMPKHPPLRHGGTDAFYSPGTDTVTMPKKDNFTTVQGYYRTLFHELCHSTGHQRRLNRKFGHKYTKEYAIEELIAEIGSSYICGYTGIYFANEKKHASYLNHYLEDIHGSNLAKYKTDLVIRASEDKTYLLRAIGAAQKAANFILSKQLAKDRISKKTKNKSKDSSKIESKPIAKKSKVLKTTKVHPDQLELELGNVATKTANRVKRKVTLSPIASTELRIIKSFLALDGKVYNQDSLIKLWKASTEARKKNRPGSNRLLINSIEDRLHKATGLAIESPEGKIKISLDKEFKSKCLQAIKNKAVKSNKGTLTGTKKKKVLKPGK